MEFGNKVDLTKSLINQKWYCIDALNDDEVDEDTDGPSYGYVVYKWDWSNINEEYFYFGEYDRIEKDLVQYWYKDSQELINKFQWYWLNTKLIPYLLS